MAPGVAVIADTASLSDALNQTGSGRSLSLFVPEGSRLLLGGAQLILDNISVTIRSSGSGAVFDGQGLSRHFFLTNGAALQIGWIELQNGG